MTRGQQILLTASLLGVIYGVPASQAALELARGQAPQSFDIFRRSPSAGNLRAFERSLEDSSAPARAVRPWIQGLWLAGFGNPGEKAVMGRDGWLFYKPDVRYLVEPHDGGDDALPAIVHFREQLERRGIRLLVVPIPGKPSTYADKLTWRETVPAASPTRRVLSRLRAAGVETIDLAETFAALRRRRSLEDWYLARDTHWSCAAARVAAQVVAERVQTLAWLHAGAREYATRPVVLQRRGDLIRMIGVPGFESRFPPEEVRCEQAVGYRDDVTSPVLVLGDSFLRIYQTDPPTAAGFIAHLARELRMPLASIVNDGGASTLVRQELSRRPGLLRGKKLVIWEFVERDIRFGAEGWQRVTLPET